MDVAAPPGVVKLEKLETKKCRESTSMLFAEYWNGAQGDTQISKGDSNDTGPSHINTSTKTRKKRTHA